jgi:hypothetical protein
MPTPPQLRITLELQAGAEPPRGSVHRPEHQPRSFWGWLQLIQAIEDAITNSDADQIARKEQAE